MINHSKKIKNIWDDYDRQDKYNGVRILLKKMMLIFILKN